MITPKPKQRQNAADPEQLALARKEQERRREQERADLRAILDTPGGRRFIARCLQKCGVFASTFTGNSETFFREGRRSVGLELLDEVMAADEAAFITMVKESRQEKS